MCKKVVLQVFSILVLSVFSLPVSGADLGAFRNYSADMETISPQGTFTSRIFTKDKKMRMESSAQGHSSITIMRPDKKVIWMLMPDSKTYMEMPLDLSRQDMQSLLNDPNVKVDKESLGSEVVDRHPAKKYHITMTTNGKKEKSGYIWEATDLGNLPVKYQSEDLKITTIWKNVKTGVVADSVFELPAGYNKMDTGGMGGGAARRSKK
ncbi:MAG: DUF4412 domain-containing protein [Nitrospirae bacterium]|nr:MAG: DUF4412 domain-containing protein [Nitrospirota bacterium]